MDNKKISPAMGSAEPLQRENVATESIPSFPPDDNLSRKPMAALTDAEFFEKRREVERDRVRDDIKLTYLHDGRMAAKYSIIFEIAERDPELQKLCSINTLTARIAPDPSRFNTLNEAEIFLKEFYSKIYRCELSQGKAADVVQFVASKNASNPLFDYFNSLPEPSGDPLADFLGFIKCDADPAIIREIFDLFWKKVFLAIIAADRRILFVNDCVLIFEGSQGIGKTTLVRYMAGDESFYAELGAVGGDILGKDTLLSIAGRFIVEIGELEGMRRAEAETLKSFLSRNVDRYRPPYGRETIDVPRVASFVGTTNETSYLVDPTGARRFYPIKIVDIDKDIILHKDIIKNLHSHYYRLALSIMDGKNAEAAMYAACRESEALTSYLAEIRPEKARASLFDDEIELFIDAAERTYSDVVLVSASDAAVKIFGDLARVPATFAKAFSMIASNRGYINAGRQRVFNPATGQTERKRVWSKCLGRWDGGTHDSKKNNRTEATDNSPIANISFSNDPSQRPTVPKEDELEIF
jgi:hypothetical protein